jgi:integrase
MKVPKKIASAPKLYDGSGNTAVRWYVYYTAFNPATQKRQRVKVYEGLNGPSVTERRLAAEKLIAQILHKLQSGWNPFVDDENYIYAIVDAPDRVQPKLQLLKTGIGALFNDIYQSKLSHLRKKSEGTYKSVIRNFIIWLEKNKVDAMPIQRFSSEKANDFLSHLIDEKRLSPTSRNKHLATLRTFFEDLLNKRKLTENPFSKIAKLKEFRQGKLAFKSFQVKILKDLFLEEAPQLWLFCQFQFYCFIRPGELRALKIENIDFGNCTILIPGTISKNKKSQHVVIPEAFYKVLVTDLNLHKWPDDYYVFSLNGFPGTEQIKRDQMNKLHARLIKEKGFDKRYSLYSWKHTGNVMAAMSGINIKELQIQNRHSDLATFDIYMKSYGVHDLHQIREKFPAI